MKYISISQISSEKKRLDGVEMAIVIIKSSAELGSRLILTPERYNPKRRLEFVDEKDGILLSEIIIISNDVITAKKTDNRTFYTINTSDAMSGYLKIPNSPEILNSNKKELRQGDVIISRLRPYLKQVAYVDKELEDGTLAASTEFFVLRSINNESIAYLVPFLLCDEVQSVFANSVEGSQHPRFKEEDLLNLIIPQELYDMRYEISDNIEDALKRYREYESSILWQTRTANRIMNSMRGI